MSKEFEDGMTMPAKVAMQTDIRKGQLAQRASKPLKTFYFLISSTPNQYSSKSIHISSIMIETPFMFPTNPH